MWNTVVATADSLIGRLILGFLNTCSSHPLLFTAGVAILLGLTLTVWADLLNHQPEARNELARPIRLRR